MRPKTAAKPGLKPAKRPRVARPRATPPEDKKAAPPNKGLIDPAERDAWLEREYRLGQLPIAEMSRQSGLSRKTIHKRATKNNWTRDLLPAVQAKVKQKLLRDAAPEGAAEDEAVEFAAERAVEVVRQHRASLGRLNRLATKLMEDLEMYLQGELDHPHWLRANDTVAGTVLRVAQALGKTVPLERQAFSVGAGAGNEPPKEPGPALPDWRTLFERAGLNPRPDPPPSDRGGDRRADPGAG